MANAQTSSDRYEYATVDSNPGAAGYYTEKVGIQGKGFGLEWIFFSIRGAGEMLVTLQFKCPGDSAWTDHSTYNDNVRKKINGPAAGVHWRAGVKQGDRTSGEKTFGFDW